MLRTSLIAVAVLFASILGSAGLRAQDAPAAKPLPAGPDALTWKRHEAEKARFWSGVLLAECEATGGVTEESRKLAGELMLAYAERICANVVGDERVPRIGALCQRLRESGCDVPVIRLIHADMLFYRHEREAARVAYLAVAKEIEGRPSPLVRYRLHQSTYVFHRYHKDVESARKAAASRDECLVELAASPEFAGGKERFFLDAVMGAWNEKVGPDDLTMLDRMEKSAGEPGYALLVLRSAYHEAMAWAARGHGAFSTVGAADRRSMGEHLEVAAKLAAKAAELCPQHPEAPTAMLKALGPGGAEPDELRRWFDRAVAAQLDWREAYLTYMHYLQPRWGGSQEALLDLGLACLATKRFDTQVPSFYRMAIHYVGLGVNDPKLVWADADVQKHLEELDRGCLAAASDARQKWTATTHRIVALALGGRAKEAAALSQEVQHRFDADALGAYGVTEAWLTKTLLPHRTDYVPAKIAAGDLFGGFAAARSPGADKAVALTSHAKAITGEQVAAQFASWFGQTCVAAYDKGGTHDLAWDADARELLGRFGALWAGEGSAATRALATKVLDSGCKDPLVVYAATRAHDDGDPDQMSRTLAGVLSKLRRSQPQPFSWWAKQYFSEVANRAGQPGVGSGLLPQMRAHILASIVDPMFAGDNRRHYIRCLWGHRELAKAGNDWITDRMVDDLAKLKGADPWLVHVVTGLHHARKAKHGQGSQNERAADCKVAAEHLRKAHDLCPQFPEAAVGMIVVASLEPDALSPREWFDRAVAAQIDYEPAYAAFVDTLRPRHGGSVLAMYRFAVECLDSGRFDTDLPLWYARTLQRVQQEVREPREAWASAGVAGCLRRLFDGYEAQHRKPLDNASLHAGRCVLAWAGGRYADALASWEAAGRKLDQRWFEIAGQEDAELIETDLRYLDAQRGKK